MSSGFETDLARLAEAVRQQRDSHMETTPDGNGIGPTDGPVLGDVEILHHLSYLTTRGLRELFKKYYDMNDEDNRKIYEYTFESQTEAYMYKRCLIMLLIPIIRDHPEDILRVVIDINNLLD